MILQSVPSQVRDELVASRRLSTFGVLTYLLVTYGPGGVSEKQNLLRNPGGIQNVLDGPIALRRWLRWRTRTKEIGAIAPDTALQLKGLLKMTKRTLESHRELQFKVSLVRSGLQVDTTPRSQCRAVCISLVGRVWTTCPHRKTFWNSKWSTKAETSRSREAEGCKVEEVRRRNQVPYEKNGFQRRKTKMQVLLERARLPTWESLQLVAWSKGWAPTMLELWKPWAHGTSLHSSKRTRWCITNKAQDPEGRGAGFIIYKLKSKGRQRVNLTAARLNFLKNLMGMGKFCDPNENEVEIEEKERGEKIKEKEEKKDNRLVNKELKRLAQTTQVLQLITLAATLSVSKAEQGEEAQADGSFSFEIIAIYTLLVILSLWWHSVCWMLQMLQYG